MELRSWMAAITFTAGLISVPLVVASSQGPAPNADRPAAPVSPETPKQTPATAESKEPATPAHQLKLELLIAGLGRGGCEVEVKPGNRSCRFKPQAQHVESKGKVSFQFKDIEVRASDRNCTFAITVREAGKESKTIYRGFRLPAKVTAASALNQTFTCYMNSPSKLADLERTDRTRR